MSKLSITKMSVLFRVPAVKLLKLFVTTDHDKEFKQEGNGGVIVVAPCENDAVKMIDRELATLGLFPRRKHWYKIRTVDLVHPYSELICDAPVNGGPQADSPRVRIQSPKLRTMGDALLFVSFDHHNYLAGVAGALAIADNRDLAIALIDTSLRKRGLLDSVRNPYSVIEYPLTEPMVEVLGA